MHVSLPKDRTASYQLVGSVKDYLGDNGYRRCKSEPGEGHLDKGPGTTVRSKRETSSIRESVKGQSPVPTYKVGFSVL